MPRTWVANSSESRCGRSLPEAVSGETLINPRLPRRRPLRSVQGRQELRERVELLGRQALVGRHDAGADLQRARDRVSRQAGADVRQLRPGAVVSVLTELVARKTAGLCRHL